MLQMFFDSILLLYKESIIGSSKSSWHELDRPRGIVFLGSRISRTALERRHTGCVGRVVDSCRFSLKFELNKHHA